jgi:hypothetical protein
LQPGHADRDCIRLVGYGDVTAFTLDQLPMPANDLVTGGDVASLAATGKF